MSVGFQNPSANAFQDFDSWSSWLKDQPQDVQEAFSGVEGSITVPSEERFYEIIQTVKSYQLFLKVKSKANQVGWGGSGLFVSNAQNAMQQAVAQAQTGQVKSFSKPMYELQAPLEDPSQQCEKLRGLLLPVYQDCLQNSQDARIAKSLALGGAEGTVMRPATLSLFGSYMAALVDDCGVARGGGNVRTEALIQNLKKYCGHESAAYADKMLKQFKSLTYKTSSGEEIPLEQLIKQNLSRFQRALQLDTSKAVVTGMQGLPNEVMLVLEDLVQRGDNHILRQLQTIDNSAAMNQVASKMKDYETKIEQSIQLISDATSQDDFFSLLQLFPNDQAQAYLYAQIGIDSRLLKLKSKPPQVSDDQWAFHQKIKDAHQSYQMKGMVVTGLTAAGMIFGAGVAGLFPPLAPFLLAGMAVSTVGFAAHDVNVAEDKYTLADVSHLASQQQGNPILAEEKDVIQAERNVQHAVAKAPAEVGLAVAGMGTAMKIHQAAKLGTGAKVLLDMGAGGVEGAMAASANWQNYDEGIMGQQIGMSFVFGMGGALAGEGLSRGLKYGVKGTRFDSDMRVHGDDIELTEDMLVHEVDVNPNEKTNTLNMDGDDVHTVPMRDDDKTKADPVELKDITRSDSPSAKQNQASVFDFFSESLTDRLARIDTISDFTTLRRELAICMQAVANGQKNDWSAQQKSFGGEAEIFLDYWGQVRSRLQMRAYELNDDGLLSGKQMQLIQENLSSLEKGIQAELKRHAAKPDPVTLEYGFGDRYKPKNSDDMNWDDVTDSGFTLSRYNTGSAATSTKLTGVLNEVSRLQPKQIQDHIQKSYSLFHKVLRAHNGALPTHVAQNPKQDFSIRTFSDFQKLYVAYRKRLQDLRDNHQVSKKDYDRAVSSLRHFMEDVMETDRSVVTGGRSVIDRNQDFADVTTRVPDDILPGDLIDDNPNIEVVDNRALDDVTHLLEDDIPDVTKDLIEENPHIRVEDNRDDVELTDDMYLYQHEDLDGPIPLKITDEQLRELDLSKEAAFKEHDELDLDPSATRFYEVAQTDPKLVEAEFPQGLPVRIFDEKGDLDPREWRVDEVTPDGRVYLEAPDGPRRVIRKKVDALDLRRSQRASKEDRLEAATQRLYELIALEKDNDVTIPVSCLIDGNEHHSAAVLSLNMHENKALVQLQNGDKHWVDTDAILPEQSLEAHASDILGMAATGMLRLARRKVAEVKGKISDMQWKMISTGRAIKQGQTGNCFFLAVAELFQKNRNFKALSKQSIEMIEENGELLEYRVTVPMGSRFGEVIEIDPKALNNSTIDGDPVFKILEYVYVDLACREKGIPFTYDILKKGGLSLNVLKKLFGPYFKSYGHMFNSNAHHLSLADLPEGHKTRSIISLRLSSFRRDAHFLTAWTKSGKQGQGHEKTFTVKSDTGREYEFYHKHAYSIAGVVRGINHEVRAVRVVNPHDTSKTIRLPIEVFWKAFNGVSGGKFKEDILLSHLDREANPLSAR